VSRRASDSETDGGAKQAGQGRSPHPFFDCTAKEIDPGARKARDPARDARLRRYRSRLRLPCLVGAAKASVHRGAEERRHGRDTRTAAIRAAQQASRVPQ
jgi:hypothetical protein